jgi:hypothetical protein
MGKWNRTDTFMAAISVVVLTALVTSLNEAKRREVELPKITYHQFVVGEPKVTVFEKRTGIVVSSRPLEKPVHFDYDDLIVDDLENPRWIRSGCVAHICEQEAHSI